MVKKRCHRLPWKQYDVFGTTVTIEDGRSTEPDRDGTCPNRFYAAWADLGNGRELLRGHIERVPLAGSGATYHMRAYREEAGYGGLRGAVEHLLTVNRTHRAGREA